MATTTAAQPRYVRMNRHHWSLSQPGHCRLCGTGYGLAGSETECRTTTCLACETTQCMSNGLGRGQCGVCYLGLLPGWSGTDRQCGYKGCTSQAISAAPRVKYVCRDHAERAGIATGIAQALARRAKEWTMRPTPETTPTPGAPLAAPTVADLCLSGLGALCQRPGYEHWHCVRCLNIITSGEYCPDHEPDPQIPAALAATNPTCARCHMVIVAEAGDTCASIPHWQRGAFTYCTEPEAAPTVTLCGNGVPVVTVDRAQFEDTARAVRQQPATCQRCYFVAPQHAPGCANTDQPRCPDCGHYWCSGCANLWPDPEPTPALPAYNPEDGAPCAQCGHGQELHVNGTEDCWWSADATPATFCPCPQYQARGAALCEHNVLATACRRCPGTEPCATCGHTRNWHDDSGEYGGFPCDQIGCSCEDWESPEAAQRADEATMPTCAYCAEPIAPNLSAICSYHARICIPCASDEHARCPRTHCICGCRRADEPRSLVVDELPQIPTVSDHPNGIIGAVVEYLDHALYAEKFPPMAGGSEGLTAWEWNQVLHNAVPQPTNYHEHDCALCGGLKPCSMPAPCPLLPHNVRCEHCASLATKGYAPMAGGAPSHYTVTIPNAIWCTRCLHMLPVGAPATVSAALGTRCAACAPHTHPCPTCHQARPCTGTGCADGPRECATCSQCRGW